jgi:hypothetical protein
MLNDYNAVLKAQDKPLRKQELEIVLTRSDHPLNALRIVYKSVIVRPHIQVKIQGLS